MANSLCENKKDSLRELFQSTGSIRLVAKQLGLSRNTVRRLVRNEGAVAQSTPSNILKSPDRPVEHLDFRMLEKMFARSGEPNAPGDFESHIKGLANSIASDIGASGRIDILRIEGAVASYISWRRFYFMSLDASDKEYCGPFKKYHEKAAIAVDRWVSASNKAFDQMNRLLRELEIKYGKRGPDLGRNNVFVNQQVNLSPKGLTEPER